MPFDKLKWPSLPTFGQRYDVIQGESQSSLLEKHDETPLDSSHNGISRTQLIFWFLLFGLTTFSLGGVTGYIRGVTHVEQSGGFEGRFPEEMPILPEGLIQIEEKTFSGGVAFKDGIETLVGDPKYVGEPSPEIDQAWKELIGDHYFSISKDEAVDLWGDDFELYRDRIRGGWTGTLDWLHCLHCLNQLRKALRRDYYPEEPVRGMTHQLHCIDHLRQVIQCDARSVISPTQWYDHQGQYIQPRVARTCRNFETLNEFSRERYNGSLHVPREPRISLKDGSERPVPEIAHGP